MTSGLPLPVHPGKLADMSEPSPESTPSVDPAAPQPEPSKPSHTLGTVCHLLGLCGYLGVPLGNVLGPLVLWLVKKEEDAFLRETGKHVLNFQISMAIYLVVASLAIFLVIGFVLVPVVLIVGIVYTIIGAIKSSEGEIYQYPLTIRFLR